MILELSLRCEKWRLWKTLLGMEIKTKGLSSVNALLTSYNVVNKSSRWNYTGANYISTDAWGLAVDRCRLNRRWGHTRQRGSGGRVLIGRVLRHNLIKELREGERVSCLYNGGICGGEKSRVRLDRTTNKKKKKPSDWELRIRVFLSVGFFSFSFPFPPSVASRFSESLSVNHLSFTVLIFGFVFLDFGNDQKANLERFQGSQVFSE